jgi:hypothetical protein
VEAKQKSKLNEEINKMNLEKTDIKILIPKGKNLNNQKAKAFLLEKLITDGMIVDVQGLFYIF